MNEIEQLKRDLQSYGYYKKLLTELDIHIYSLKQKIKREESPHAISYSGEIATYICNTCGHIELVPSGLKNVECRKCDSTMMMLKGQQESIAKAKLIKVDAGKNVSSLIITLASLEKLKEEYQSDIARLGLDAGLAKLTEEQLLIIKKHYFEGVCYEHVGMMLGMNRRTVIRHTNKALHVVYRACRKQFQDFLMPVA
ncbi:MULTISPECIES: sigma factor-like helix-turn-helix DNA-binding protein [unclassified Breznakia]|uniref:sigma factor-like helix-turn-helix DNA-binding protein n=1 Tax=unclassified Breznakia TaxID=2623764 RepID=UPI002477053A|nr:MULTISPECIES: sigma factor-like helix-turn-helix DNA-binding protein [unclassified Breznakia]MDH6367542.1 DNA-directed RNA polymerase subunit RPC12/RpoP [Breznakia sp. PH1-1]MDH6404664.1 DNA-directed RNA polymerase subunit RPC12/RpoP [Breznakia sp. PF1-11]MDH6412372.1 DNA-directed RNA polymerase subunit RPC12/RpoP [Breznakia sp. PFB1-11]MDH6414710.1 DNA-directed RNA polymerase subunit RPC12/RpoP [Breznakia sp. PFB1-14]MDH6417045.1 DNA-directed RNA polymerase subunit RPC12/RpoP [Breznakia sp